MAKQIIDDMIGQRFGKLVVTRKMEKDPNQPVKDRRLGVWWYADCDCGTKDFPVKGTYLRAGRRFSCGCYNRQASHDKNTIDLTGQKYGMLTVIQEAINVPKPKGKRSALWRCQCECGNIVVVSSNALRIGGTISCGCISSKHEMIIRKHLQKLNIKHIKQYWFEDLRSPITGYVLKFDVAIFDAHDNLSFIVEYDGQQHFNGTRFSPHEEVNKQKFERTKLYDGLKNEYCKEHHIDLLRISYKDKDKLLEILNGKLKQKGLISDGIC